MENLDLSKTSRKSSDYGCSASVAKARIVDKNYVLEVDLPGVKPESLDVSTEANILTVEGKRRDNEVKHSIRIPKEYDLLTVDASLANGVLTCVFQPKEKPKSGKVKVIVK